MIADAESPAIESRTTSASVSASDGRRIAAVRDRDDAHTGCMGRADPVSGVFDRGAACGLDSEATRRLEEHVGSGLPAPDLLRGDSRLEELRDPGPLEYKIDDRSIR